ncbi:ephrin-A1-like [Stylophora pistillata]|uniref:ephrin-A1-like n=1 Tax=Stylophora pistillata TaxID=50429 RepID=UPI000C0456BD|nr:ephrin-A1-like [Stylophora pistillata]
MVRTSIIMLLAITYIDDKLRSLVRGAVVYPSLQWNYRNPKFQEGSLHFSVLPGSKLNIICPHVAVSFVDTDDTDSMLYYENIWQVDNTSYQTCNVNTSIAENKIVLKCADPRKMHFTTIVFQRFSAANSHRFEPGRTYYFVCKCVTFLLLLVTVQFVVFLQRAFVSNDLEMWSYQN